MTAKHRRSQTQNSAPARTFCCRIFNRIYPSSCDLNAQYQSMLGPHSINPKPGKAKARFSMKPVTRKLHKNDFLWCTFSKSESQSQVVISPTRARNPKPEPVPCLIAYDGCVESVLEVDQGSLHVDPHRLGPVLLEDGLAVGRTDRLRVLPGDVTSGKDRN